MIDLETLGTRPGSIILSIGVVEFSVKKGIGAEFYQVVNRQSCVDAGLTADVETVLWWGRQSKEAASILEESLEAAHIQEVIDALWAFFTKHSIGAPRVWGNGAAFDNAIMAEAYARCGRKLPWRFSNDRCYRTLKALFPDYPEPLRIGTHHNALDDARHQANHAIRLLGFVGGA